MKKMIIILVVTIIPCISVIADDAKFSNALKNCSTYSESGVVNTNGINATSIKKILGWNGDRCQYKESIKMGSVTADVSCNFTRPQIKEIASVMDAYMLTLKYTGEDVDTSSPDAVQNNPVVKVWNKYMQNPDVCSINAK